MPKFRISCSTSFKSTAGEGSACKVVGVGLHTGLRIDPSHGSSLSLSVSTGLYRIQFICANCSRNCCTVPLTPAYSHPGSSINETEFVKFRPLNIPVMSSSEAQSRTRHGHTPVWCCEGNDCRRVNQGNLSSDI
ncbi:hypothetical protein RSAG8_04332, partial [Rhizoctonia solani AG-8 WAC10335]